jgi:Na+/H+ antiporter NhaD/arsenite permease-like protein
VEWLAHSGLSPNVPHNLVLATAALSNLINNSAAVMLLIKVVNLSQPVTAYVLALANSFGGSLFIVDSVSIIIVMQQAGDLELITHGLESRQTAES